MCKAFLTFVLDVTIWDTKWVVRSQTVKLLDVNICIWCIQSKEMMNWTVMLDIKTLIKQHTTRLYCYFMVNSCHIFTVQNSAWWSVQPPANHPSRLLFHLQVNMNFSKYIMVFFYSCQIGFSIHELLETKSWAPPPEPNHPQQLSVRYPWSIWGDKLLWIPRAEIIQRRKMGRRERRNGTAICLFVTPTERVSCDVTWGPRDWRRRRRRTMRWDDVRERKGEKSCELFAD